MRTRSAKISQRGFTLIELSVVCLLTAMLASLMTTAWVAFGRPAVEVSSRVRLAREARLAVASLAADLGGGLAGPDGWRKTKLVGRLVGRLTPGHTQIRLCYDGGDEPDGVDNWTDPDHVISYDVVAGQFLRHDLTSNTDTIIASDVDSLVTRIDGNRLKIQLTFRYRELVRVFNLEALAP